MDHRFTRYDFNELKQQFPILLPFNTDLDNRQGQHITYRTTRDYYTLNMINQDISLTRRKHGYPTNFNAIEAKIVTYNEVPHYQNAGLKFTYQIIIATDYHNTFTILNYNRIDSNGNVIGVSENGCVIDYISTSSNQRDLTWTSNVGRAGKHIFLLTQQHCKGCTFRSYYMIKL